MLKKIISTGLCCSLLFSSVPVFADTINSTNTNKPAEYDTTILDSSTLQSKLMLVEQSVYGQAQSGALLSRISRLEYDFYGKTSSSNTAISDRINTLYATMFDNSVRPSTITQLNGIEWFLSRQVSTKSVTDRLASLETNIYGKIATGTLQNRMNNLALVAYGNSDSKTPLVSTTIPADTLIKIKLITPLNSDKNKVGDEVLYQAAEDVIYNGKLIIAAGSPGKGVVTKVKSAKNFGRNGEIDVDFQQMQAFDGTQLPTFLGDKAKMEIKNLAIAAGASVAGIALLGPIGIVGGFFVNGKDVDLPAGTESYVQTKEATNIYAIETTLKDNLRTNPAPVEDNYSISDERDTSSSSNTTTSTNTSSTNDNYTPSTNNSSTPSNSSDANLYKYEY